MAEINGTVVAMAPPDGYVVDFDNPKRNLLIANYVVMAVGLSLSIVFLAQRIFVKIHVHRGLGLDDYCVIVAWMFVIGMHGMLINGFAEGLYGTHVWELPIDKFSRYVLLANYVQALIYVPPTLLSKLALLIFYLKLQNRERWFQWSTWFTIFVVVGSNLGILFSVAFACNPIAMAYDISVTEGTCIDRPAVFKATAAFGVITDVMIFCIPIPMVINLHISRRKKIGLFVLFAIGSATVITSIVRLILLIIYLPKLDFSWLGGPVFLWITIEANLLIICACLPTLKHFVQAIAPTLLGSSGITGKSGYNSAGLQYGSRAAPVSSKSAPGRPKPRRENYHDFDGDNDFRMETFVQANQPGGADTHTRSRQGSDGDKDRDDDSAKAIMQTRTLQIHYEDRGA